MDRIVDITQAGRHLSKHRGFLLVEEHGEEIGRIALDEIHALIIHAHGITYSNSLLSALADLGAIIVICGSNHFPRAIITPLAGHYMQGARMQAQWKAGKPLHKQLWKQIVASKIAMQISLLEAHSQNAERLKVMRKRLRSGDPENFEAQAARVYWPLLFGKEFRRDRQDGGANAMLNYGYTVLRAALARAIIASGLNASIGIHHHNQYNAFALVDDVMEPFRPLIDAAVLGLVQSGANEVDREVKECLTRLIALDLKCGDARSPLTTIIAQLCFSLSESFEEGKAKLNFPAPPSSIEWRSLGKASVET